MTDTPGEEDVLAAATTAEPSTHTHRSHRHSRRRRRRMRAGNIAIIVAVVVVLVAAGIVVLAKSNKSTSSALTTTTIAAGAKAPAVWIHADLTGKRVTVVAGSSALTKFVKLPNGTSVPGIVAYIDKAFAQPGCAPLEALYKGAKDQTTKAGGRTKEVDSAYAKYALEQGANKHCSWANTP